MFKKNVFEAKITLEQKSLALVIVRTSKMFFWFFILNFLFSTPIFRLHSNRWGQSNKKLSLPYKKTRTKHTQQKNIEHTPESFWFFSSSFALLPSLLVHCCSSLHSKIESSWKKIDWTQTFFSRPNTFYNWSETQPNSTTVGGDTHGTSAWLCAHRHICTRKQRTH